MMRKRVLLSKGMARPEAGMKIEKKVVIVDFDVRNLEFLTTFWYGAIVAVCPPNVAQL